MKGFSGSGARTSVLVAAVLLIAALGLTHAQYWFQTGARGSTADAQNGGGSVQIETVYQPGYAQGGSFGFWVGENLANGAFLQTGYEIPNVSGMYPTNCTSGGCTGDTYIAGGTPTWFWEYFPAGYSGGAFYGGIGGNGSVGPYGKFNTYSFNYSYGTWNFYFNGVKIGSANLGAQSSGANPITAFAEYADVYNNTTPMAIVDFRNLSTYTNGVYRLVQKGYSYVGYGSGSETSLKNLYGIQEVAPYTNYFEIGSGLQIPANFTQLWAIGYKLNIRSQYGNINSSVNYSAYSQVKLSAPHAINVSNNVRLVFAGWTGTGDGSYTGTSANETITMNGNINETAEWTTQYYLNVTSAYGSAYGSGWYDTGASARYGMSANTIPIGYGSREVFVGWSNGSSSLNATVTIDSPKTISAEWKTQYLVSATSQYGSAYGSGWYDANSTAHVYISDGIEQINSTNRNAFVGWSNGDKNMSIYIAANRSVLVEAMFAPQVLVNFKFTNAYGAPIYANVLYANGEQLNSTAFVFANTVYTVEDVLYKSTDVAPRNSTFVLSAPGTVTVRLPVFNVTVQAESVFGTPLNASVGLSFKNGSTYSGYLGTSGAVTLHDVPYGYLSGSAKYMGTTKPVQTEDESSVKLVFLTLLQIAAIIIPILLIAAIAAVEVWHRRHA
jgi:hypothetical protein